MLHFLTGSKLVGYAEDGGEMLSIAVACCSAFILYRGLGRYADLQALDPSLPFSKRT
ncbi:hypothetical protein [Mesorhizobium sp.]|nr:hypothetical protein [Mesorhizobium sp.]